MLPIVTEIYGFGGRKYMAINLQHYSALKFAFMAVNLRYGRKNDNFYWNLLIAVNPIKCKTLDNIHSNST